MLILVEFVTLVADETLVGQSDVALVGVLLMNSMEPEAFFGQVASHGEVGGALGREQVGDVHQHLCLGVGFEHVEHVVADDGVELPCGVVGAIVVVVAGDVVALPLQFVGVETEATAIVEYLAPQQLVLQQVAGGYAEVGALDGSEIGVVYLLWFHSLSRG